MPPRATPCWRIVPAGTTRPISRHNLKDAEGNALTDERIADMDPQHWAVWLDTAEAYIDIATGDTVPEEEIDFDTLDDPDTEPAEGYRHYRTVSEVTVWEPNYFCSDVAGAGVTMPDWLARQHGVDFDELTDASDPDGAAARERAREEKAEKERAERRKLIALNKLGKLPRRCAGNGFETTCYPASPHQRVRRCSWPRWWQPRPISSTITTASELLTSCSASPTMRRRKWR